MSFSRELRPRTAVFRPSMRLKTMLQAAWPLTCFQFSLAAGKQFSKKPIFVARFPKNNENHLYFFVGMID